MKDEEALVELPRACEGKGREVSVDEQVRPSFPQAVKAVELTKRLQPIAGPSGCAGYLSRSQSASPELQDETEAEMASETEFATELEETAPNLESTHAVGTMSAEEMEMEIDEADYSALMFEPGFVDDGSAFEEGGGDLLSAWIQAPSRSQCTVRVIPTPDLLLLQRLQIPDIQAACYPSPNESNSHASSQLLSLSSPVRLPPSSCPLIQLTQPSTGLELTRLL